MKDYFSVMEGEKYVPVVGDRMTRLDERWAISPKGPNERMRFLKYSAGQFFRRRFPKFRNRWELLLTNQHTVTAPTKLPMESSGHSSPCIFT